MDGRCCALTGVLDSAGQHKRCALTDSGNGFCVRYHETPDRRIFGTVWEHAKDCRVCYELAPSAAPPPPQSKRLPRPPPETPTPLPASRLEQRVPSQRQVQLRSKPAEPPPASQLTVSASSALAPRVAAVRAPAPVLPSFAAAAPAAAGRAGGAPAPAAAAVPVRAPPLNAILYTPVSAEARELEARYTGPSGLKLRVRVARGLQPANWCAPPPDFASCIDPQRVSSSQRIRALEARLNAEEEAREEKREAKRLQHSLQRAESRAEKAAAAAAAAEGAASGGRGAALPGPRPVAAAAAAAAASLLPAVITSPISSDLSDGSGDVIFVQSTRSAPAAGGGAAAAAGAGPLSGSAAADSLPRPTAAAAPAASAAAGAGVAAPSELLASMRALHRSALAADLESSPMGGDSWLTSTLIDAVAFEFACAYPDVHFLPTSVLAFELPNAARQGALAAYTCTDLLGRPVLLAPDAAPPVLAESSNDMLERCSSDAAELGGGSGAAAPPARGGGCGGGSAASAAAATAAETAWTLDTSGSSSGSAAATAATAWLVPRGSALSAAAAAAALLGGGGAAAGSHQHQQQQFPALLPYPGPSASALPQVPTALVPASSSRRAHADAASASASGTAVWASAARVQPAAAAPRNLGSASLVPRPPVSQYLFGDPPLSGGHASSPHVHAARAAANAVAAAASAVSGLGVPGERPPPPGYVEYLLRYRAAAAAAAAASLTRPVGPAAGAAAAGAARHVPASGPRLAPGVPPRPMPTHLAALPHPAHLTQQLLKQQPAGSAFALPPPPGMQPLGASALPRAIPGLTLQQVQHMQQQLSLHEQLRRVAMAASQAPPAGPSGRPAPPAAAVFSAAQALRAGTTPSLAAAPTAPFAAVGAWGDLQLPSPALAAAAPPPQLMSRSSSSNPGGGTGPAPLHYGAPVAAAAAPTMPASTGVPGTAAAAAAPHASLSAPAPAPAPLVRSYYCTGTPPPHLHPRQYCSSANKPLVAFWNIGNMHWNLVRVQLGARFHALEIFEPMGRPSARSGSAQQPYKTEGLSLRSVPAPLLEWLDAVCPLSTPGGWRARTVNAITTQHQGNGFDCGVACLLYAEKCGQGQEKVRPVGASMREDVWLGQGGRPDNCRLLPLSIRQEDIGANTDQDEITFYRTIVASYLSEAAKASGSDTEHGAA